MSSAQPSSRPSQNSSPLPSPATTQSLVVSKVSCDINEAKLLQDLRHSYVGVEKVSRLHDKDGEQISAIKVDFVSNTVVTNILKENSILLNGKRHPVRPYLPPNNNRRYQNEEHRPPVYLQEYLTEERVVQLFKEQKKQLEAMINVFENKCNARLASTTTSSTNANADQLLPIFKDLTTVCQQFNQQNGQMQKQLESIANRVQDVQVKPNNGQAQQTYSRLPIQNGH